MPDHIAKPSQLAIDKLLTLIASDENIPMQIKQMLSSAIPTSERAQIEELIACLTEWANDNEDQEHPAE